jgi:hypothetical protein
MTQFIEKKDGFIYSIQMYVPLRAGTVEEATTIITRVNREVKERNGIGLDFSASVYGVDNPDAYVPLVVGDPYNPWPRVGIYGNDVTPDDVIKVVKTLVDELQLGGNHVGSFIMRQDFMQTPIGGGVAFIVTTHEPIMVVDAEQEVRRKMWEHMNRKYGIERK